MIVDANGVCLKTSDQALEDLYQNKPLTGIWEKDVDITKYNHYVHLMDLPWTPLDSQIPKAEPDLELFASLQNHWLIPEEYQKLDVESLVLSLCNTDEERQRVNMEMEYFKKVNWIPVLQTLKYIVDTMRQNQIVWGVGRGSSVASYTLFLLGVHKIDSIYYQLDFKEFAKT